MGQRLIIFTAVMFLAIAAIPGAWVVSVTLALICGWGYLLCTVVLAARVTELTARITELVESARADTAPEAGARPVLTIVRNGESS